MSMQYPVKFFRADMREAPALNGTPNSLINILKKCLIEGFGEATALSATIENNICTITFNENESFFEKSVVEISGSTLTSLNTEHRVVSSTNTSITIKTLEPNQVVTGTIKVKYAPIGDWTVPLETTSISAFKSNHPEASGTYFLFDDTNAYSTQVCAYKKMITLTNTVGKTPNQEYKYIPKSNQANTGKRGWFVIGDYAGFYIITYPSRDNLSLNTYGSTTPPFVIHAQNSHEYYFGDYIPEGFSRKQTGMLVGDYRDYSRESLASPSNYNNSIFGQTWSFDQNLSHKPYIVEDPLDKSTSNLVKIFNRTTQNTNSNITAISGGTHHLQFYHPLTKLKEIDDLIIFSNRGYRLGKMPGAYKVFNRMFENMEQYHNLENKFHIAHHQGKRIFLMSICTAYSANYYSSIDQLGIGFFDYVGPWR